MTIQFGSGPAIAAVIDDDARNAAVTGILLQEAGYQPLLVDPPPSVAEALDAIGRVDAVVCDHRLSVRRHTSYDGAELAARLFRNGIAAILVTQFFDMDVDVSIRRVRRYLPVVLPRDEADSTVIADALTAVRQEIQGVVPSARRPWRTLVRIESVNREANEAVIDVVAPAWNPQRAVRLPMSILPASLADGVAPQVRLLADVNIGAERPEDLFFAEFAPAPEPLELP